MKNTLKLVAGLALSGACPHCSRPATSMPARDGKMMDGKKDGRMQKDKMNGETNKEKMGYDKMKTKMQSPWPRSA